ncbi:corepressor interacting with RBPJ 1 isoform X1 [Tachypleus tridentatus]|uniref:corepressor interacting with RBPJ 1 isoform X1 n=1 Tax=Tachypleus tridentatus TaxID=6853 RepID=UPI003FD1BC6D
MKHHQGQKEKDDDEPEYKFEWQRKYNAPREDFAKDNAEIRDQPFGIPVRNVRCIKCHKWGHINTDKECPLFNKASTSSLPTTQMDPLELMKQMRNEGYSLKQNILGHQMDPSQSNQQMLESEDEEDPEVAFLRTLSTKQKKKLLRKLNELAEKNEQGKKRKKSKKKSHKNSSDFSDSDISCKAKKKKKSKKKSHHYMSSSSCSSDTEDGAKSFSSSNFDVAPKKRKHKNDHHKEETNKRHKFQKGL